jgi:hypothetical protein
MGLVHRPTLGSVVTSFRGAGRADRPRLYSPGFLEGEFPETPGIKGAGGNYPRLLLVVANLGFQYSYLSLRCASHSRQLPWPWMPFLLKTKEPSPPLTGMPGLLQCVTVAPLGKLPVSAGGPPVGGGGPMTLAKAGAAAVATNIAAIRAATAKTVKMRFKRYLLHS